MSSGSDLTMNGRKEQFPSVGSGQMGWNTPHSGRGKRVPR